MSENPTFQIPKDVIQPIINAQVALAVTNALGDKGALIESAVRQVLFMKVNSEGKKSDYGYSSDIPFVQWVMLDAVKTAVREAVIENMQKHKESVKKAIADEFKKANTSPLVKSLITGMTEALTNENVLKYRIDVRYDGK